MAVRVAEITSVVALRTAQRLAEERDDETAVRNVNSAREERPEHRVIKQPGKEHVDSGDKSSPPPDRMVEADLDGRVGNAGAGGHGGSPCKGWLPRRSRKQHGQRLSNEYSFRVGPLLTA